MKLRYECCLLCCAVTPINGGHLFFARAGGLWLSHIWEPPPPKKKKKFSGQTPIRFLRSVSCIWRDFRDKPQQIRDNLDFFRGAKKVRSTIPRSEGARECESGAPVMLRPRARKLPSKETSLKATPPFLDDLVRILGVSPAVTLTFGAVTPTFGL